nr:multiple epidermal growth factor-like domains protein 10 [Parasteatoda tepidariorum]
MQGFYGHGCQESCRCGSHPCDPTTGVCLCPPGFTGSFCNEVCPSGKYGPGCRQRCKCQHGGTCDPITGKCTCTSGWIGSTCSIENRSLFGPYDEDIIIGIS